MPPIAKYTKQEITNTAFELVKKQGYDTLTARDLAKKLGTSTRPIFTAFENMEELKKEVIYKSAELFEMYKSEEIKKQKYPEYKARGMAYIRFAKEEKNLFKLLFMRDRTNEKGIEDVSFSSEVSLVKDTLLITPEAATEFHVKMWIWVHGISTIIATGYLDIDFNTISDMLSDVYNGLKAGATI